MELRGGALGDGGLGLTEGGAAVEVMERVAGEGCLWSCGVAVAVLMGGGGRAGLLVLLWEEVTAVGVVDAAVAAGSCVVPAWTTFVRRQVKNIVTIDLHGSCF